jgi:hypothetical protein
MQSTADDGKVSTTAHKSSTSNVLYFPALLHRKDNDSVTLRPCALWLLFSGFTFRAVENAGMATSNPAGHFESDMRYPYPRWAVSHRTRGAVCTVEVLRDPHQTICIHLYMYMRWGMRVWQHRTRRDNLSRICGTHTRIGQYLVEHAPQYVLWKSCVISARPYVYAYTCTCIYSTCYSARKPLKMAVAAILAATVFVFLSRFVQTSAVVVRRQPRICIEVFKDWSLLHEMQYHMHDMKRTNDKPCNDKQPLIIFTTMKTFVPVTL